MPEGANVEIAHKLSESGEDHDRRRLELGEILEAIVLAIVAIATAWSGYQSARWDGRQSLLYGHASSLRFEAEAASARAGQIAVADVSIFNGWLEAHQKGDRELATMFERRFTPAYKVAFDAWLKTDPFHDADAPPGPIHMPEYRSPDAEKAAALNAEASASFDEGTAARETADRYVRETVLLATVLLLVAISQRFRVRGVRIATLALAGVLTALALVGIVTYPRL